MPVRRRIAKGRRPTFPPDVLALFVELERIPEQREAYSDGSRELARLLGMTDEWWGGNSVLDRSRGPCHPPGYGAYDDWFRCRVVREQLLEAMNRSSRTGSLGSADAGVDSAEPC
jgi:hypothetical protein